MTAAQRWKVFQLCVHKSGKMVVFTLASDVTVTSWILNIHSFSSSWLFAAISSNGPIRNELLGTREKTCGLLPFPSGRTTENKETKYTVLK